MLSDSSLDVLTNFAIHIAQMSGQVTLEHFRNQMEVHNKVDHDWDPVTEADRSAEKILRKQIETSFPTHGIIGEEFGETVAPSSFTWILDPIDGTRAYVAGLPTWATLIGLYRDGQPHLGVMYQPYVDEIFVGFNTEAYSVHRGVKRLLASSKTEAFSTARVGTTSPHLFATAHQKHCLDQLRLRAQLLRYGCDAYSFAMVAAGQLDIALDPRLQIYDIAALIPIIQGAGGVVSCWDGSSPEKGGDIVAAGSQELLEQAHELLSGTT